MTAPRYPNINVPLVGEDGNAFAILGRVSRAMRFAGVPANERDAFVNEAKAGDYDHLLATVMRWVNTDDESAGNDEGNGDERYENIGQ